MSSAALRLVLLVSLLAAISAFQVLRAEEGTPVMLAAGALLLCGLFAGKVAAAVKLPRLTGYLVVGILIGPHVLRLIPREGVAGLELVQGLAVSLIALTAGTELRLGLIRRVGRKVFVLGFAVSVVVFVSSMGAMLALRPLLPFLAELGWAQTAAVAAMVASIVVSFSPTVTFAIVQETGAEGTFTEFLMALVIIGDLLVMVAFALGAGVTKASLGGALDLGSLMGGIGWELFGSLGIGSLLGLVMLLYLRRVGRELPIFISAMCFASAELGTLVHLSPLLLSLAAGAVIANLDEKVAQGLHHAIARASLPVFALFFAVAGAGLHLDVLTVVGPVALVLVAVRAASIFFSVRHFAPPEDERLRRYLWMGLISQAGVTFGLAALMRRTFPGFGAEAEVLIVAMVTIHELVGPVLTRKALERSGEVVAAEPEKV